jgi:hypothetical protein
MSFNRICSSVCTMILFVVSGLMFIIGANLFSRGSMYYTVSDYQTDYPFATMCSGFLVLIIGIIGLLVSLPKR